MKKWSVASALVAVLLLLATVKGQQSRSRPTGAYVANELLLKFTSATNTNQRNAILAGRGVGRLRRFEALDIDHVRLPPGLTVEDAIARFRTLPGVMLVQPNYTRRAIQSGPPPNDPYWLNGNLWGLERIQVQSVWTNFTQGDGSVVVASIDTGVNYNHPDLAANMWHNPLEIPGNGIDDDGNGYIDDVYGIDTVNHDGNPLDDQGHGTHTSGTVAAVGNNGLGVTGVNWNAKILACKFLDASGSGTDAGAIECFNYIVAMKNRGVNIRVSTNSWGEARGSGPPATAIQAAIDAAGAAGIINIFGAGNDGTDNDAAPFDPASYTSPSVVAVASSDATDMPSYFSNYGATSVDLAAPGEDILSTYLGTGYTYLSGTSMATPHVAGVAALLAQMDPTLSVAAIKSILLDSVDQIPEWNGLVASGGRLNAFRAATAVGFPGNVPPSVSITSPSDGTTFTLPATIAISATASDSDGTVQSVAFYTNGTLIGTSTTSPYGVTWANVPSGTYTLTAVATDNHFGTTTSAPVHVTVPSNLPPSVSLANPADGATFTDPVTITLSATAGDSDGSIQQVAFYANGAAIGTDTTSPYSIAWNAPMGVYALTAVATDNLGATTTSAPVHVTVNPIPDRINVALSANGGVASASSIYGANYPPAGAINGDRKGLNWGAGGGWNDGTSYASPDWLEVDFHGLKLIDEVDVFSMQDNYSSPIDPTPTATFTSWGLRAFEVQYWDGANWVDVINGAVTNNNLVWRQVVFAALTTSKIRLYVTGALNGYSRVMELEAWGISAGGNTPPDASITSPAEGATFTAPSTIAINVSASDSDGSVQQVDFYANGLLIGTDSTSPYGITRNNVSAGTYTLTTVATDNTGATTTSAPVHVTVVNNTPPSVSITSPIEGASFTAQANITVASAANDNDGSIASVAFYANGVAIGTDTTSPYSVTWGNVSAGTYALTAVATDNLGATTTSAVVHVTVNAMTGRTNFALPANGGAATASSTYNANYPAAGAINGDRKGLNWGAGGGWNDGTPNASPDWLEVDFNGPKSIDEVDVFSMQDNYSAPVEPTPTLTFTSWGLRAFEAQYWTGAAWVDVPGGSVTNNNLVWRRFAFAAVTTSKIRVYITGALNGSSRVMEAEAWGPSGGATPPPGGNPARINMALAANGGLATASSTYTANYPPAGATNGDRKGLNWGAGGGWNDGTANASPDWIEVDFNGSKAIDEVNVFSMQDNYNAPVEPTPTMTFTSWGLRAFEVQYWTGTAWVDVPNGAVTGNSLVWRQFTFGAVTTSKIRVYITGALNGYSRVIEVEAWGVPAGG